MPLGRGWRDRLASWIPRSPVAGAVPVQAENPAPNALNHLRALNALHDRRAPTAQRPRFPKSPWIIANGMSRGVPMKIPSASTCWRRRGPTGDCRRSPRERAPPGARDASTNSRRWMSMSPPRKSSLPFQESDPRSPGASSRTGLRTAPLARWTNSSGYAASPLRWRGAWHRGSPSPGRPRPMEEAQQGRARPKGGAHAHRVGNNLDTSPHEGQLPQTRRGAL